MTFARAPPGKLPRRVGGGAAVPILLDLRGLRDRARGLASRPRAVPTAPLPARRAAFAVLVFILIAHWFVALKPETERRRPRDAPRDPDEHRVQHRLTLEPSRFLWAVMPMAADFAYSIVYLLGGEYAARLLVFSMLLASAACSIALRRRGFTRTPPIC